MAELAFESGETGGAGEGIGKCYVVTTARLESSVIRGEVGRAAGMANTRQTEECGDPSGLDRGLQAEATLIQVAGVEP